MSDPVMPRRVGGRPPRSTCRSSKRIEFVVTPEERAELARVAAENQMPVASLVREAVNTLVADYRDGIVFIQKAS